MTIAEMITRVNGVKPNSISSDLKISWMVELSKKIKEEVIDTHEKKEEQQLYHIYQLFESNELNGESKLDIPDSHLDVYEYYLQAKIDYQNSDYDRYQNSMIMFNSAYSDYRKWYNRNYMPL